MVVREVRAVEEVHLAVVVREVREEMHLAVVVREVRALLVLQPSLVAVVVREVRALQLSLNHPAAKRGAVGVRTQCLLLLPLDSLTEVV